MQAFEEYIGIDYSGAGTPTSRQQGLAVCHATHEQTNIIISPWSRVLVYEYLCEQLSRTDVRIAVGIDHGFGYPFEELRRLKLEDWNAFAAWFVKTWNTEQQSVASCMSSGTSYHNSATLRYCERNFAPTASSVLDLERKHGPKQAAVSYSTHAGLPWVIKLSKLAHVDIWPFQSFGNSHHHLIGEAYPRLYKPLVNAPPDCTPHERDAYAIAEWLRMKDEAGMLSSLLSLEDKTEEERALAVREGWIMGG